MPKVTYIEANGAQHVIDVPIEENVMRGAQPTPYHRLFPAQWA